jgi:hypothetical protein
VWGVNVNRGYLCGGLGLYGEGGYHKRVKRGLPSCEGLRE